jgi:glutamyl-tRNA synthetase
MAASSTYAQYQNVLKNAVRGAVCTRFPPEPSGYLHVGHVKAAMLNYHYAKIYEGKMRLRFDDTNPSKENEDFVENIKVDLQSLEIFPDEITHTSDHFDRIQELGR